LFFEDGDVVVALVGGEFVLGGLEVGFLFGDLLGDGGVGVAGGGGADFAFVGEEFVHDGVEEGAGVGFGGAFGFEFEDGAFGELGDFEGDEFGFAVGVGGDGYAGHGQDAGEGAVHDLRALEELDLGAGEGLAFFVVGGAFAELEADFAGGPEVGGGDVALGPKVFVSESEADKHQDAEGDEVPFAAQENQVSVQRVGLRDGGVRGVIGRNTRDGGSHGEAGRRCALDGVRVRELGCHRERAVRNAWNRELHEKRRLI
jgi:hypothetical protein